MFVCKGRTQAVSHVPFPKYVQYTSIFYLRLGVRRPVLHPRLSAYLLDKEPYTWCPTN